MAAADREEEEATSLADRDNIMERKPQQIVV